MYEKLIEIYNLFIVYFFNIIIYFSVQYQSLDPPISTLLILIKN